MRPLKHSIDILPLSFTLVLFSVQLYACYMVQTWWHAIIIGLCMVMLLGTTAAFNHYHQHHPTFTSPFLNRAIEVIFGLQTGLTTNMWVIHHNIGHHKYYLNQNLDAARWCVDNKPLDKTAFAIYHFINGFKQIKEIGKTYPGLYKTYLQGRVIYYLAIVSLLYYFGLNYIFIILIPSLIIAYYTIETTWHHHAGLETTNHYVASRNNLSFLYNFRTCNLGYHTAHHVHPTAHWSTLPKIHDQIKSQIPDSLIRSNIWHA